MVHLSIFVELNREYHYVQCSGNDSSSNYCTKIEWKLGAALFKVDGALRGVGGENDYIYYAGNHGIHKILKK